MSRTSDVFKVAKTTDVKDLLDLGKWEGSDDDRRDGFIHLSGREQLTGTLVKHYEQRRGLWLLVLAADDLGDALVWEPSRGGELFPHLYAPLTLAEITAIFPIPDARDGWEPPRFTR